MNRQCLTSTTHEARTSALRAAIALAVILPSLCAAQPASPQPAAPVPPVAVDDTAEVLRQAEQMAAQTLRPAAPERQPTAQHPPSATMPAPIMPAARLYVFVSFSMPAASLHRLAAQTAMLKVPLVLRGMSGESLAATARRAATIVEAAPGASFEIDPAPFRRFGITRVPAFLIAVPAAGCKTACTAEDAAAAVVGDVTLDYALERLARGSGAASTIAQRHLANLKEKR